MSLNLRENLYRISLAYIKKERYTGSCDGLRFFLEKKAAKEEGEEDKISVCLWPEPYCFEKTDDSEKHYREFAFSDDGLNEAIDYLSETLNEK